MLYVLLECFWIILAWEKFTVGIFHVKKFHVKIFSIKMLFPNYSVTFPLYNSLIEQSLNISDCTYQLQCIATHSLKIHNDNVAGLMSGAYKPFVGAYMLLLMTEHLTVIYLLCA